MVKGKIIEYLKALSREEFERLNDFLHSPVFINSKTARAFYSFAKKKKRDDRIIEFTWKDISDYVYKGEKYNENRVMKLVSDFCKILERYFEFLIFEKDERYRKNALLQSLRKRELKKHFQKEYEEIDFKDINITADDCYYAYANYLEKSIVVKKIDLKIMESKFGDIITFVKLEHLIMKAMNKSDAPIYLEKEILTYLHKNEGKLLKEFPSLYYRYQVYKMFTAKEQMKIYYELKRFLGKNGKKFDKQVMDYFRNSLLISRIKIREARFT
ncbi:MAG: hypothetical protein JSS63_01355 [Bacteroidetes bacterium]|nr:hypothetical protein [Bacteroidota bacterium]